MHEAVARAGPEDPLLRRRFVESVDNATILDTDVLGRDPAGDALFVGIVGRQIRADDLPALTAVRRAVQVLTRSVDGVVVVR